MKNSPIEWTHHTVNFWWGCTKVSPGCFFCYAAAIARRFGPGGAPVKWGAGQPRAERLEKARAEALALNASAAKRGVRERVFVNSMSDWLDVEVPIEWLAYLLETIRLCPWLDFQLLTKRPENWRARVAHALNDWTSSHAATDEIWETACWIQNWLRGEAPANVWVGTTVEDQTRADERIPALLKIPARVRFLSCEPLLGPVEFEPVWLGGYKSCDGHYPQQIHWVIVGGESGPGARPFIVEHAWDIGLQCQKAGVPVFVKQLGGHPVTGNANAMDWPDEVVVEDDGESAAGGRVRLVSRKGSDLAEWPEELRVRQFPEARAC